jgi:hypothetical protein
MAKAITDADILSERGIRWSEEVDRHARLYKSRLVSCDCTSTVEHGQPLPTEAALAVQSGGNYPVPVGVDEKGMLIDTLLTLRMFYAENTGLKGGVDIHARFRWIYKIDGEHDFREEHLRSFATWSCQPECWPELQELVRSLTVRMGLPPYNVPPHRTFLYSVMEQHEAPSRKPKKRTRRRRSRNTS